LTGKITVVFGIDNVVVLGVVFIVEYAVVEVHVVDWSARDTELIIKDRKPEED
jgi:hypothetical protein